jgi:hypothetical protein
VATRISPDFSKLFKDEKFGSSHHRRVLSLALVILQVLDFSMHSVGLECAAKCCQWDVGWESQLPTKLSEDRVLDSNMLLVVGQQGVGQIRCSPAKSKAT